MNKGFPRAYMYIHCHTVCTHNTQTVAYPSPPHTLAYPHTHTFAPPPTYTHTLAHPPTHLPIPPLTHLVIPPTHTLAPPPTYTHTCSSPHTHLLIPHTPPHPPTHTCPSHPPHTCPSHPHTHTCPSHPPIHMLYCTNSFASDIHVRECTYSLCAE